MPSPAAKICDVCGRRFEWRRAWSRSWDQMRRCSAACRKTRLGSVDRELEDAIMSLLRARSRDASICPSEAARVVRPQGWRADMERTRRAARRLAARGEVVVLQAGRVVPDPSVAKGPIRVRLAAAALKGM